MKKNKGSFLLLAVCLFLVSPACQNKKKNETKTNTGSTQTTALQFDSTALAPFFDQHPDFKNLQKEVVALYQKQDYRYIWFDRKGVKEIGYLVYNKATNMTAEGIATSLPYQEQLEAIFQEESKSAAPNIQSELLLSCMYFYYTTKVYGGLSVEKSTELGWYLPRKKLSFVNYLDSLLANPSLIHQNKKEISGQYYRLREVLKKYRKLEETTWDSIVLDPGKKALTIGDTAAAIVQIRNRLYQLGDLRSNSKSSRFDSILSDAITQYARRNGLGSTTTISKSFLSHLNVPIAQRIKTIIVNMERSRWFSSPAENDKRFIFINIPAYQLRYFENGAPVLESKVVVGKSVHKTVIFSAEMKYIVFSPYWNIPKNIVNREILPEIEKNPDYLAQQNMEWNEGGIRQKPGPTNALGKVKFVFPNSNAIYLHDTPSKSLFDRKKRAFSHGCIRLEKPAALAQLILKDDPKWSAEKIDKALTSGIEKWYALPRPIPVYIGYFTAWVTQDGNIHFYEDVYQRDERLAAMLVED